MRYTECAQVRTSLGVYVLGAIGPAERAEVDLHLRTCRRCRDELAGLAGLPALLGRVSHEQLAEVGPPPAELLDSIVARAAEENGTRQHRNVRWMAAAAAVALLVAGAGVIGGMRIGEDRARPAAATNAPQAAGKTVVGRDPKTGLTARVAMTSEDWGTSFTVHLTGAAPGSRCRLVAVDRHGWRDIAGGWRIEEPGYADFHGSSMISRDQIAALEVRSVDGKRLLLIRT